jgi:hypothetical protein
MWNALFINAIQDRQMIEIAFYSKEDDDQLIVRRCAPMDIGPSRRAKDQTDRFHAWDFEAGTSNHTLSLKPEQVQSIRLLSQTFNPEDFITWSTTKSPWFVSRNWGRYS